MGSEQLQLIILPAGIIAILFALYLARDVLRRDTGTKEMEAVAATIFEGAVAFIRRQYVTIAILALVGAVVIGMGLNVNWPPDRLPEGATALSVEASRPVARDAVLDAVLDALRRYDAATVERDYRAALATIGQRVRVELPGDATFEGIAVDVDGHCLVVRTDTGRDRTVLAGDVIHLRPA